MKSAVFIFGIFVLVVSCTRDEPKPSFSVAKFPDEEFEYYPTDNGSVSNEIAILGRVLFYDVRLSKSNTVSCASCHKQKHAFADNVAFSEGFDGELTIRNAMPLQNFPDSSAFFWDGRETGMDGLVLKPILNHIEMGMDNIEDVKIKLSDQIFYAPLLQSAFGNHFFTQERISLALSLFVQAIKSTNSKFDKHVDLLRMSLIPDSLQTQGFQDSLRMFFTDEEVLGHKLFLVKYDCNSCHQVEGLGQSTPHGYLSGGTPDVHGQVTPFANIGLEAAYMDEGRNLVTSLDSDRGKFKIPSLRNVALTAPYMHDGRFKNLSDVVDFYAKKITNHNNLDPRLKSSSGEALRRNITEDEKYAIIAFLRTLTDNGMVNDTKYSNPFHK